jgi:hypothetical protein
MGSAVWSAIWFRSNPTVGLSSWSRTLDIATKHMRPSAPCVLQPRGIMHMSKPSENRYRR